MVYFDCSVRVKTEMEIMKIDLRGRPVVLSLYCRGVRKLNGGKKTHKLPWRPYIVYEPRDYDFILCISLWYNIILDEWSLLHAWSSRTSKRRTGGQSMTGWPAEVPSARVNPCRNNVTWPHALRTKCHYYNNPSDSSRSWYITMFRRSCRKVVMEFSMIYQTEMVTEMDDGLQFWK